MKEFTVTVTDKILCNGIIKLLEDNGYNLYSDVTPKNVVESHYSNLIIPKKLGRVMFNGKRRSEDYTLPQDWDKVVALIKKSNETEFKKGDWVVNTGWYTPNTMCIKDDGSGFGMFNNKWSNYLAIGHKSKLRKATKEEIEQALIEEAKRRGFEKGVEYNGLLYGKEEKVGSADFKYYKQVSKEFLTDGCGDSVYVDGKWAEIIEDKLTLAGYEVEESGHVIKIGCKHANKKDIDDFITMCDRFNITDIISVDAESPVRVEDLHKLRKRYL